MKLSRGARRDNLFNSFFFRCPSALALICMKLFNVCANKLSLSLSLSLSLCRKFNLVIFWFHIKPGGIIVNTQQWPTPSESIAIYCVRKLVSCVLHIFSPAQKSTFETKRKNLRTVAKIKTQDYKNWAQLQPLNKTQLQHCSTNQIVTAIRHSDW